MAYVWVGDSRRHELRGGSEDEHIPVGQSASAHHRLACRCDTLASESVRQQDGHQAFKCGVLILSSVLAQSLLISTHLDDRVDDQDQSRSDSSPEPTKAVLLEDGRSGVHSRQFDALSWSFFAGVIGCIAIGLWDDDSVRRLSSLHRPDRVSRESSD